MGSFWSKEKEMDPQYQKAVHAIKVLSELNSLRQERLLCDCSIIVGKNVFKVHRNVLAANSQYFRDVLTKRGSNIEKVEINNVDSNDIKECIEFMYRNEALITQRNAQSLRTTATTLKLQKLIERCDRFLDNAQSNTGNISAKEEKHDTDKKPSDLPSSSPNIDYEAEWKEKLNWIKGDVKERKIHLSQVLETIRIQELPFDFIITVICKEQQLIRQVKGARDLVANTLFGNHEILKSNISLDNFLTLKTFSKTYRGSNHHEIKFTIDLFLLQNIKLVVEKDLFKFLEKEEAVSLLKRMKTGRKLEEIKWKAALSWLKYYNRLSSSAEFLPLIRFDKLPKEFVQSSVLGDNIVKGNVEIKRAVMDLLFDSIPTASPTPAKKVKLESPKSPSQTEVGQRSPNPVSITGSACPQSHGHEAFEENAASSKSSVNLASAKKISQILDMQLKQLYEGNGVGKMIALNNKLYFLDKNNLLRLKFNDVTEAIVRLTVASMERHPSPSARMVTLNHKIYIIEENTMSVYDLLAKTWKYNLPGCKLSNGFCATGCGPYLYAMGGEKEGDKAVRFDPATGVWSEISRMLKRRYGAAATAVGGVVYVMGGFDNVRHNSVECYNRFYDKWTTNTSMNEHRRHFNVCVLEGNIFALGGNSRYPIEVRNKLTGTWDIIKTE